MQPNDFAPSTDRTVGRRRGPRRRATVFAVLAPLALLAGCSAEDGLSAAPPAPDVPSYTAAPDAPSRALPPLPGSASAEPAPADAPQANTAPTQPPGANADRPAPSGSCGTVTAASGLTLQVLAGDSGGVDCGQATQIVERFHGQIAGKQNADSREPVAEQVADWQCVSGPPSAQGGTTCLKGEANILAAVVPLE